MREKKKKTKDADGLVIVQGCTKEENNIHASNGKRATTALLCSTILLLLLFCAHTH